MKLSEIKNRNDDNIWYHGSPNDFEAFNLNSEKINRSTNISGVYITHNPELAHDYATRMNGDGYVYEVAQTTSKIYREGRDKLTDKMLETYADLLDKHTTYRRDWIDSAIVPEAKELNRLKSDISGDIKRLVFLSGGYDGYYFNDMGDMVLVVLDGSKVTILDKKRVGKG